MHDDNYRDLKEEETSNEQISINEKFNRKLNRELNNVFEIDEGWML